MHIAVKTFATHDDPQPISATGLTVPPARRHNRHGLFFDSSISSSARKPPHENP
jgi:hypothetical protein